MTGQPPDPLKRLIVDFSLEVPAGKVAALDPGTPSLPPGSMVFLPHLAGREPMQLADACRRLVERGYVPVPHLAARHLESEQAYRAQLEAAREADHLLVLGGDRSAPAGPFSSAIDLLRSLQFGDFEFRHVMISGYPEGHPRIGQSELTAAMRRKLDVLEQLGRKVSIVSQFAFDPTAYVTWVGNLRDAGVGHDLRLGIAGVTSLPTLVKYALMCGIGPSLSMLHKRSGAVIGMLGSYSPENLAGAVAKGLENAGLNGVKLHFFPFGGAAKTLDWVASVQRQRTNC